MLKLTALALAALVVATTGCASHDKNQDSPPRKPDSGSVMLQGIPVPPSEPISIYKGDSNGH